MWFDSVHKGAFEEGNAEERGTLVLCGARCSRVGLAIESRVRMRCGPRHDGIMGTLSGPGVLSNTALIHLVTLLFPLLFR
jgi:hypothetical protein